MALTIYDTRERKKVALTTLNQDEVKMYTCGPTVYKDAHIGNYRAYMFEDLLRRTLKYLGYQVTQVMNITDVDDKTIKAARETGRRLHDVTEPIIDRFFEDLNTLRIERAEHYPRATEHIPEMISLIQQLMDKGYAYKQDDNIYFSISKFKEYGQLSGMKLEKLTRGVRIDQDEYEKEDFRDFALWKGWSEDDGEVGWDSPFGRGRPGWHIECSAMSQKYLGSEFDIHTGGVDNIFPHHENEIAQSVAATGAGFARHWMHCEHLFTEGEKMSKSLDNFHTLRGLIEDGYSAREIRYTMLTTHYRQRLNFTLTALAAAVNSLERLDTLYQSAASAGGDGSVRKALELELIKAKDRFMASLEDDLGIANAMAALFDFVSNVHRMNDNVLLNKREGDAIVEFWVDCDRVLDFLIPGSADLPADVHEKVSQRLQLRERKEFDKADKLRDELVNSGYQLEDGKGTSLVIWKGGRKMVKLTDELP